MSSSLRQHNANSMGASSDMGFQNSNVIRGAFLDAQREYASGANLTQSATQQSNSLNPQQLKDLFHEFKNKDRNAINAQDFLNHLIRVNMNQSCSLLIAKLKERKDRFLSEQEFYDLFNFDFVSKDENLNLIIGKFKELTNNTQLITNADLNRMNTTYGLGLSSQEIEVIMKYGGSPTGDYITIEQLRNLISGKAPLF